jgi:hypothetical protein
MEARMIRTLAAVAVMTAGIVLTAFAVSATAIYVVNEHCTERMAWDGNC